MSRTFDPSSEGRRAPFAHDRRLRHGPHGRGAADTFRLAGRGRRSRRGDVRAAVLLLLAEQSRNGYQLIQELEERSHQTWRPSPGSVYPVLSQLEDEGLVVAAATDAGRVYTLTDAGRRYVEERREGFGLPWEAAAAAMGEPRFDLVRTMRQVVAATRQVMEAGSEQQIRAATEAMRDVRRRLYGLLAEEDGTDVSS